MNTNIANLEPKQIWHLFAELLQIPRPSKHEEQIRKWIISQATKLNLAYVVTPIGNIVIQKPATSGLESCKKVTLQCHMDMVPAKLATSTHDFLTDPISAYIDGDWVKANGTTLGADNGIGLAIGLAVMAANDIAHGPLELLITTDEEAGMSGAFNLRKEDITGDILINLDSENDQEVCISCAGGVDTEIEYTVNLVDYDSSGQIALKIYLGDLVSGHSGVDIHLGRANANKEIASLLYILNKKVGIRLAHISGGKLRNVIPTYCEVIIVIDENKLDQVIALCKEFRNNFMIQYQDIETKFKFDVEQAVLPKQLISQEQTSKIINAINGCFNGIYQINWSIGIAQMSSNLGIIKLDNNRIKIVTLQRAPDTFAKYKLAYMLASSFEAIGATVTHLSDYPGWLPNLNSEILAIVKDSYKRLFQHEIKISATHGGLECGLIMAKAPFIDAVSIGATILDPHSANERLNIKSVAKIWKLLKDILGNIPFKS